MYTKAGLDSLQVVLIVLATLFIQSSQTDWIVLTTVIALLLLVAVVLTAYLVRRLGISLVETSDNLIHRLELEVQRKQGEIDATVARLDRRDEESRRLEEQVLIYRGEAERLKRSLEIIAESVADKDAYIIQLESKIKDVGSV